jgi:hypothetical protein
MTMEWISVKERLPETSGMFLVYAETSCSRDFANICAPVHIANCVGGEWWAPYSEVITHWMPLPAPPFPKFLCNSCKREFAEAIGQSCPHCPHCGSVNFDVQALYL